MKSDFEMCFERDYKLILSYAKRQVDKRKITVEPEELIADTYLELTNCEYNVSLFLKTLANISIKEQYGKMNTVAFGESWYQKSHFTGDRVCITCHEILPAAMFGIIEQGKTGHRYLRTKCKECMNKKLVALIEDNPHPQLNKKLKLIRRKTSRFEKERNKIAVREFVSGNRKEWNAYLRNRDKKGREELSDAYCRKLLRKKYTNEFLLVNPLIVEEYKNHLQQKRLRLAS